MSISVYLKKMLYGEEKEMGINLDEYEAKDCEEKYMTTSQWALYSNMTYKQTFSPVEAYDVAMVSLRMGFFDSMEAIYPGHEPKPSLNVTITVRNLDTGKEASYKGIPDNLVNHGILPWVHMQLSEPVHFEPGHKGEIHMASEGGWKEIDGVMKGKSTIFYIARPPNTSYTRGGIYRWQYWNKTWMPLKLYNKPIIATFKLWNKKPVETIPEPEAEPMALCPSCGFVFPPDNTIIPQLTPGSSP